MKLVTCLYKGEERVGALTEEGDKQAPERLLSLRRFFGNGYSVSSR